MKEGQQLVTQTPIENTPFKIIGLDGQGYFLALGEHRVTELRETEEEAREMLETHKWDIFIHMICIVSDRIKEAKEIDKMAEEKKAVENTL